MHDINAPIVAPNDNQVYEITCTPMVGAQVEPSGIVTSYVLATDPDHRVAHGRSMREMMTAHRDLGGLEDWTKQLYRFQSHLINNSGTRMTASPIEVVLSHSSIFLESTVEEAGDVFTLLVVGHHDPSATARLATMSSET
jgi:hypothetical protein